MLQSSQLHFFTKSCYLNKNNLKLFNSKLTLVTGNSTYIKIVVSQFSKHMKTRQCKVNARV